jgi:hypothetical protein
MYASAAEDELHFQYFLSANCTPGGTIVSIWSSTLSGRWTPAAVSWDSRCSMVRGPMMAAVIAGWRSTNPMTSSISVRPALLASAASCPAASSLRWLSGSDRSKRLASRRRADEVSPAGSLFLR